ncbi:MAG: heme lyase CcmF/NrfE family subunit [Acidimicrobiia bacterium]
MIALSGSSAVIVALVGTGWLAVQGVRSMTRPDDSRRRLLPPLLLMLVGAAAAMVLLELALLTDDFSIEYVARNHSSASPLPFTIASGWAALEGSIVLWGLVLAGYGTWVWARSETADGLAAGALAVIGAVGLFFFGVMATIANPFATIDPAPLEGFGANPLLQNNILMAVHPPLLYLGYVGFTVPFAFAVAALIRGDRGAVWLERTRRWSLVAWGFLTAGIVLGGLWSYQVLGWGGYWAWDPVENASFIPWLVATAFIHSAVVQRRRGMLAAWNVALVIATFALTILGTFLTRSGVIASVHSFTQSAIGPAVLAFLAVVVVGSFTLFALRAQVVAGAPRLDSLASREGVFLFNNLLLALFAFTVLVGTIYPILVEAFTGDQVSVGAPFFDRAAVPIGFALLLAMGVGPVAPYRKARWSVMVERLRGPLRSALVTGAVFVMAGLRRPLIILAVVAAAFVVSVIVRHMWVSADRRHRNRATSMLHLMRSDPAYWGGQLAHIGVAVVAVAIAVSSSFSARTTIPFEVGESAAFEGYTLTYISPFSRDEGRRTVIGATVEVTREGERVGTLRPRLNQYPNQVQPVASPAVMTRLRDDLYLSLVRIEESGTISLDVFRFPLMWLLWAGGGIVVGGAAWSLLARKPARVPVEV